MAQISLKIACVGEAMIEMSSPQLPGNADLSVAGDTFNTAVYLRRALAAIHDVYFVTQVGMDHLSDQMIAFMKAEGVETDLVRRSQTQIPGIYSISTDADGERTFQYWRENSAAKQLFQRGQSFDFDELAQFELIYTSAIAMAVLPLAVRNAFLDWIEEYRSNGGLFAFDSNYRPALWENAQTARSFVERAWKCCDIALPSIDDEMALFGDENETAIMNRFSRYKSCIGAMKRGALGPLAINANPSEELVFPKAHYVVDTTAAGDSFSGAFVASHLEGESIETAMMRGHQFASDVIAQRGAIIPRSAHTQLKSD